MAATDTSSRRRCRALFLASLTAGLLLATGGESASADVSSRVADSQLGGQSAFGLSHRPVCGGVPKGFVRCHSEVVTNARGKPLATSGPSGYGPADLQSAYGIGNQASSAGGTQTLAIVDAYDDPKAEADLAVYRNQFGLSPCTTANGCFRKVNQGGGTTPPSANSSWAEEISLDLDMASAICPNCDILLVEANSASDGDLDTAVDRAATMGATQISNSYGGPEYSGETSEETHFNHPGVAITVSSGDSGYGVEYPASSRYVTAVGGTSLTRNSSTARGWSETAWSGAGSGCSAYITKPSFQTDTGCSRRTVADVSAVADPNTGVSVYDSYSDPGWLVFGGTSAAAPIVAGFDALIGSGAGAPSYPYSHTGSYYDVTSGSNARHCTSYLCSAGVGYDGPTGLGTPKGSGGPPPNEPPTAAFSISPNPAQTGDTVTFNASASSDSDGSITHYKWDLDGNGTYETDTGSSSSATKSYASAQSLTVRLQVTDNDGATSSASHQFTVNSPTNRAPTAQFTISPNPATGGQTVSFNPAGSSDPDGALTRYDWSFGDGASKSTTTGQVVQHAYFPPVTTQYQVRLTVTDNASTPATGTITHSMNVDVPISQPGGTTGSGGTSGGGGTTTSNPILAPVLDIVSPVISSLRLTHSVFRAAPSGASIARVGRGTRIRLALTEAAFVTFRLQRARAGRKVHGRCVRPSSSNRGKPRCTRWVKLRGKVRRSAQAGSNSFRFSGRWRRHRLRPGRYRMVVVAVDPTGNRSHVRSVRFRIVR